MPAPFSQPHFATNNVDEVYEVVNGVYYQAIIDRGWRALYERKVGCVTKLTDLCAHLGTVEFAGSVKGRRYAIVSVGMGLVMLQLGTAESRLQYTIAAGSLTEAKDIRARLLEAVEEPPTERGAVRVKFRYLTQHGSTYSERPILVPDWEESKRNYSADARGSLERLMAWKPREGSGRLAVLHGPPGTGKTSAIRMLADQWRSWCSTEYIVDPERFFGEAHYMVEVMLSEQEGLDVKYSADDEAPVEPQQCWRMIVVEDAEEFFATDSKERVGQGLGRLLNLSDGMVGQGLRLLIVMTTNVSLATIHEAIIRPGRCFAHIKVPPLSSVEATHWLGRSSPEATLAELYAQVGEADTGPIGSTGDRVSGGVYL